MTNSLINILNRDPLLKDLEKAYSTLWDMGNVPIIIERAKLPKINAYLKNGGMYIDCIVPYMSKEDLKIEIDKDSRKVSISGEIHQDDGVTEYFLREVSRTSFSRVFGIPKTYNLDELDAKLENGILTIFIPLAKNKEIKKIAIK